MSSIVTTLCQGARSASVALRNHFSEHKKQYIVGGALAAMAVASYLFSPQTDPLMSPSVIEYNKPVVNALCKLNAYKEAKPLSKALGTSTTEITQVFNQLVATGQEGNFCKAYSWTELIFGT